MNKISKKDPIFRAIFGFLWCLGPLGLITGDWGKAVLISAFLIPWMILGWWIYGRAGKSISFYLNLRRIDKGFKAGGISTQSTLILPNRRKRR